MRGGRQVVQALAGLDWVVSSLCVVLSRLETAESTPFCTRDQLGRSLTLGWADGVESRPATAVRELMDAVTLPFFGSRGPGTEGWRQIHRLSAART